jgi:hypothetical protein
MVFMQNLYDFEIKYNISKLRNRLNGNFKQDTS